MASGRRVFLIAALLIALLHGVDSRAESLRVGVYQNYPLVYVDDQGLPAGLHVDILNAIAVAEGWTLDYRVMTWADIYTLTQRGELDIATSMVATAERREWFDFGKIPVATLWGQVVLPVDSPVKSLQSLDGARVGVLRAGINGQNFQKVVARFGLAPRIVPFDSYDDIMKAIQTGELDAGVINSFWAVNLEDYEGLVASDIVFSPSKVGFGYPRGRHEDVREAIDRWLAKWKKDPDSPYARAMLQYGLSTPGGEVLEEQSNRILSWLDAGEIILAVVLVTILLLILRMRARVTAQTGQIMALLEENRSLSTDFRKTAELLESVTHAFPDLVWVMDAQGHYIKRLGAQPTHLARNEQELIGKPVETVLPPPYGHQVLEAIGQAMETGMMQTLSVSFESRRDHRVHTWEVRVSPIEPRSAHQKVVAIVRDTTHVCTLQAQRDMDNRLLDAFARAMPDLGFILNEKGDYVTVIGDESLLADSPENLIGRNIRDVLPEGLCDELMASIERSLATGKVETLEYTLDVPAGARHFEARIVAPQEIAGIRDERHVVLVSRDVTDRLQAENQIRRLAYFDEVTGLPNRKAFHDNLDHALDQARRQGNSVALLMLDLDDFKAVNDTWGHPAGDRLLKDVAQRIRGTLRATDVVARLGGDEFVILHDQVRNVGDIAVLCGKLLSLLAEPINLGNGVVTPRASIGIAVSEAGEVSRAELVRRADLALYRAKEAGKGQWAFYDEKLSRQFAEQVSLLRDLEQALEAGDQLYLEYQPQIDNETGRIVGVEALCRWRHPEKGMIPPGQFIRQIEDTHLIHPLGERIVQMAAAQLAEWERAGIAPDSLAVNISARQFNNRHFASQLLMWLDDAQCDPSRFEVEVTETAMLEDIDDFAQVMGVLTGENVRLSLDDFGTGYSSMIYLQRLPFYKLKIDQEFVRGITRNSHDREIVRAIIGLGRNLGMACIAEGVETAEQLAVLRALGCQLSQGYYFARPQDAATMTAWLKDSSVEAKWRSMLVEPDLFLR
ncbi:MAG: EAL domain-containing protein [Gammaproteobacteria bacterium]|nr:MAG: EAL domain-containing protein [Gammaproteobacteria bacterium]